MKQQIHPNKRDRRREEREKEKGPERKILTFVGTAEVPELAILECGHQIKDPPVQKTTRMLIPKVYRCIQCKDFPDE